MNDELSGSDHERPDYRSMDRSRLADLAVAAIREHRARLSADQEVYDDWLRASEDASVSADVKKTLQGEYLVRQEKSEAQQSKLSDIIDALGFVPTLPEDNEEPDSE